MNTQELIEKLRHMSNSIMNLTGQGNALYDEAAQALTASQERERALREALESISKMRKINSRGEDEFQAWDLRDAARQALKSAEQQ